MQIICHILLMLAASKKGRKMHKNEYIVGIKTVVDVKSETIRNDAGQFSISYAINGQQMQQDANKQVINLANAIIANQQREGFVSNEANETLLEKDKVTQKGQDHTAEDGEMPKKSFWSRMTLRRSKKETSQATEMQNIQNASNTQNTLLIDLACTTAD